MEAKKIGRGLDGKMIEALKESEIIKLYERHKRELFLGIRNNYVNLYYNGASICKIEYQPKKKTLMFTTHSEYLEGIVQKNEINSKKYVVKNDASHIINNYKAILTIIDKNYSSSEGKAEKTAQQKLIKNSNLNCKAEWFCIDMEYIRQRENKQEDSFGRFDIIAIKKEQPHTIALIELKVGSNVIGGNSGIAKHLEDYNEYFDKKMTQKELIPQLISIVNSYIKLGIEIPFEQNLSEKDFEEKPQPYFIVVESEQLKKTESTIKKYIFSNEDNNSKYNFEAAKYDTKKKKMILRNKKKDYRKLPFTPKFLLTEKNADKITDIIEDSNYENITF